MKAWRVAQGAVLVVGLGMVAALLLMPPLGLTLVWNILIPVAPALLVFAPGIWRNICPLGTTGLLARHAGKSAQVKLTPERQGRFALGGLALLLVIVPLRHVVLNTNGPLTALALMASAVAAAWLGTRYEWKSGWCAGLCPVHPVEKLYGVRPAISVANAHCDQCQRCSAVCSDSAKAMHPLRAPPTALHQWMGTVLTGGFAGYVWGWFQVADGASLSEAFALPFAGMAVTLVLFLGMRALLPAGRDELLVRTFASAAVATYYWYRLPMLLGFGAHPGDGVLVDLSANLPEWTPHACRLATTALFGWWLVLRTPGHKRAWSVRPPYATGIADEPEVAT